ncbi:MAG: SLBB domain-containing protein [Ktedonobacterales bacterium]
MRRSHSSLLKRFLGWRGYGWCASLMVLLLLAGIAVNGLLALGRLPSFALQSTQPAIRITGPGIGGTSAGAMQAYVLGAVVTPGVYTLPDGARVHDLVAAAGGLAADADATRVDLAARLADGQEVYVPAVGEQVPLIIGGKVDVNLASAQDLHNALGLSLTIARRIISYRATHGPFTAVSQLLLVPITRSTYDRIKDLITI